MTTNGLMSRRLALAMGLAAVGGAASRAAAPTPSMTFVRTADGRAARVFIWPAVGKKKGVILFSHGAGSTPEHYLRVIEPWSQAGYEVLAPRHPDSSDDPDHAKFGLIESWKARLEDMRALAAFVDAPSYIAAGHSYGGLVALTLGGATAIAPPGLTPPLRDMRAKCVVALSPPGFQPGIIDPQTYSTIAVPAIIQTGTMDIPPHPVGTPWQSHLAAYDAAPTGDKYALVLEGVNHLFGGLICYPNQSGPPEETQLVSTVALTTDFLNAYGAHDKVALAELNGALAESGSVRLSRK